MEAVAYTTKEIEYTGFIAKVGRQGKELPNGLGNG